MHPHLNIAITAIRSAGRVIVRHFDQLENVEVTEKRKHDYVTQVDQQAEEVIIQTIRKAYPEHGILAEESGQTAGNEFTWVIDPLDGTTNFIHGFPHFAVSIAVKKQGKTEVAVIYDPIRQELFSAVRGRGAHLDQRRLRVSNCKKLDNSLIGTGFPFREIHHFKPYLRTFETIFPQTGGVRRAGAAALDLAYVAAGRLDGFWEAALKEWDMAAGALLIEEAGGMVGDFNGEQKYLETGNIIAGNPKIFKNLQEIIHSSLHA